MLRRRVFLVLIGSVIASVIAFGVYWCVWIAPLPFRADWWEMKHWADPLHKRHRIADWFVSHHSLKGQSRENVEFLLGPVPETDHFQDWDMVYVLGAERGLFSIDSEWLVLNLDDAGLVDEYRIVRD